MADNGNVITVKFSNKFLNKLDREGVIIYHRDKKTGGFGLPVKLSNGKKITSKDADYKTLKDLAKLDGNDSDISDRDLEFAQKQISLPKNGGWYNTQDTGCNDSFILMNGTNETAKNSIFYAYKGSLGCTN